MPFRRTRTGDQAIDAVQDAVEEALRPLQASPLAGAAVLDIELEAATDTKVAHRLGRRPLAWWIASPQQAAQVHQVDVSDLFVTLRSDVHLVARLVVL